jgi:hypothetical protein
MTETRGRYMRSHGDDTSFGWYGAPAVTYLLMGSESDDIDAGWDEASPTAAAPSAAAPLSEAPRASDAPVASKEAFEAYPAVSRRPGAYVSSESLSPSEVTPPPPSVERSRVSRFAPIVTIVALAAASVVWLGRAPKLAPPRPAAAAQPASESLPTLPLPAPVAPVAEPPAAPIVTAPTTTTPSERLEIEPLVLEAPKKGGVTVRSVPDGASFFEAGKRLGSGTVQVNVVRDGTVHLTALLNGYRPLNFKVDGSSDTVTVQLTPVGEKAQPATLGAAVPAPAR